MADKEKKDKKNWFRKAKNSLRKNQDGGKNGNNGVASVAAGVTNMGTEVMNAATNGVESTAKGGKDVTTKVGSGAVDTAANVPGSGMDLIDNIPVVGEITTSSVDAVGGDDVEKNIASDGEGVVNDGAVPENDRTWAIANAVDTVGTAIGGDAPAVVEMTTSEGAGTMGSVSTGATNVTDVSVKENVANTEAEIEKPLDMISADTTNETACVDDVLDMSLGASSVEKIVSVVDAPLDTNNAVVECKDTATETTKVEIDPRSDSVVTDNEITPLEQSEKTEESTEGKEKVISEEIVPTLEERTDVERKLCDDGKPLENGIEKERKKAELVKEKPLEILKEAKTEEKKGIVGLTRKTPDFLVDFEKRRSIGLVGNKPDIVKGASNSGKAVPAVATAAAAATGAAPVTGKMEADNGVKEMTSSLVQQGEICAPVPTAPSCDVTDATIREADKPEDEEVESVEEVSDVSKSKMSSGEEILHVNIQEEQFSEILSGQLRIKEDLIELRSDIYKLRQELHEFRKVME